MRPALLTVNRNKNVKQLLVLQSLCFYNNEPNQINVMITSVLVYVANAMFKVVSLSWYILIRAIQNSTAVIKSLKQFRSIPTLVNVLRSTVLTVSKY